MKKKIAKSLESRKRVKDANKRTYEALKLYNEVIRKDYYGKPHPKALKRFILGHK